MNCGDWMGGQSGPSMDSRDFVDSQSITPIKTIQGESSSWTGSETGKKVVGNGGRESYEVVFMKDNVSVHPARCARERVNGLLRLTKLGPSLFMTWTPPPFDAGGRRGSTDLRTAEKDKSSCTIGPVSLAEMRSIRRHTPSVGLQYVIIVLTSGLSFPPLYFHTGGVKEFFATLRNHALLVRSIDDPSVYFVNNVHVQNQEKEAKGNDKEEEHENEKKEKENEKENENEKEKEQKIEQDLEPKLEKETENKDNRVQVADRKPVVWPDMIVGNPPPSSMDHTVGLDTPPCRRYRRCAKELPTLPPREDIVLEFNTPPCGGYRRCAKNLPTLPPPKEDIVLEFTTSFYPFQKKEKETEKKITEEEAADKNGSPALVLGRAQLPPLGQEEGAVFFDNGVQVVGPKPIRWPDVIAGNPSPSSVDHTVGLDTPPRKRYRRCAQDLPALPPPKENIVLEFTKSLHPIRGRNSRKTVDLVLPPVAGALTPVYSRNRKTVDLVLSPIPAESPHLDVAPTSPHTTPIFVGSSNKPRRSSSITPFASPVVEPESSPQPRTAEEGPSSPAGAPDGALSQSPLLGRLSSDDAAPSNALEGVGHFSRLFCSGGFREGVALPVSWRNRLHLAELASEECALARRRREWWLGTCLSASVATGIPSHVIRLLFTSELFMRLMVDSGLTYKVLNFLKYIDKFGVLKHVTSGEICRYLKTFFSKATRNRLRWQRMGGVISGGVVDKGNDGQQQTNEQPLATSIILPLQQRSGVLQQNDDNRERPARRWVERSAREALRQVFEDWGCREITPDETVALAAQFQGNPDAMQIMQLFRNWAHNKRRMDRTGSYAQPSAGCQRRKRTEAASQTEDAQQAFPHTKKRSVRRTWLQSESQPLSMEENAVMAREVLRQVFEDRGGREITTDEAIALAVGFRDYPNATQIQLLFDKWAQEKRRRDNYQEQLITYRQALQRTRLADAAKKNEDAQQVHPLVKKPSVLTPVSGCNSLQSESQPTGMEDSPPGPPALEMSRRRVQGSARGGRRQSRLRGLSLPLPSS